MQTVEKLREFIKNNFYAASKLAISDTDSLLDLGIIDSTGVLELVNYLEKEFDLKINDDEIVPENLDSIANLCAFLDRKNKP